MTARPRIIFVNRFYWPDEPATAQLLTDLAEGLAAAGFAITIITSRPAKSPIPETETRRGVEIVRISGPRLGRRHALLKALDFASFSLGALRRIYTLLKPHDLLVVMTDPPLLCIPATHLARRRGARVIHWIQDVYPEIVSAVGGTHFAHVFRSLRDHAWKNADACVTLGSDMAAFVGSRGVAPQRITLKPNWAPDGLVPLPPSAASGERTFWNLTGKFVVLYSGNLGRVHDLAPLLAIAEELRSETDIVFLLVGDGAQKPHLQATANQRGLTNLRFQPAQPRSLLGKILALADLHLVTLREGCEHFVFPSKLYGIAAVGRPVLFIGPKNCELAHAVTHQSFGLAFTRDAIAAAAGAIRHLRHSPDRCATMSSAAIQFNAHNGGLSHAIATWTTLLNSLMPLANSADTPPNTPQ